LPLLDCILLGKVVQERQGKGTMGKIGFIGFGEAAQAFAAGWAGAAGPLVAHDIKLDDLDQAPALRGACAALSVTPAATAAALADRDLIFCLVTADQALAAARAAPPLGNGALWLDGNSCSPGTKAQAAAHIGPGYVDMAIMAPVHPARQRTPILLSGPRAEEAAARLATLDMRVRVVGERVGIASTVKMLRSVVVKGMEALTAEAFLAARRAGVDGQVLGSLLASDPGIDWPARGAYNLERMLSHGPRRAAEMREVAATLRELGLPDAMACATADWQDRLGALALDPGPNALGPRSDLILAAL
jgi:3-hydroxyisobutyrate dehydrogenase-like beta-hydroxyacid dehydrogenase